MLDLYLLFDRLTDGIFVSDGDGKVLYMNPAARRMLKAPDRPSETPNTCSLLCGKLFDAHGEPCVTHCPLMQHGGDAQAVTFQGRYGPQETFEWKDLRINRREEWAHLRVRCLKAPGRLL